MMASRTGNEDRSETVYVSRSPRLRSVPAAEPRRASGGAFGRGSKVATGVTVSARPPFQVCAQGDSTSSWPHSRLDHVFQSLATQKSEALAVKTARIEM